MRSLGTRPVTFGHSLGLDLLSCEKSITPQEGQGGQVHVDGQQVSRTRALRARTALPGAGVLSHAPGPSGCFLGGHRLGGPGRPPPGFHGAALKEATDSEPAVSLANTTGLPRPYLQFGKSSANGNFFVP